MTMTEIVSCSILKWHLFASILALRGVVEKVLGGTRDTSPLGVRFAQLVGVNKENPPYPEA